MSQFPSLAAISRNGVLAEDHAVLGRFDREGAQVEQLVMQCAQGQPVERGRLGGRGASAETKLTPARRDAAQAWCEIAKALASSDDLVDRGLGRSVVKYARWQPGVRYEPPEKQPQRELPRLERTISQRTLPRPEPGWER